MTAIAAREMHRFQASGREFVYLVPSAAIFALDDAAGAILDRLQGGALSPDVITRDLQPRFPEAQLRESLEELHRVRAIADERISFLTNEEALVKLTADGPSDIDVVVVVAGQPAKLLVWGRALGHHCGDGLALALAQQFNRDPRARCDV